MAVPSPALASFLKQFYGTESQYFYRTGQDEHTIIVAQEGIKQGDPAGPAVFACGLKAPLDELREALHRLIADARNNQVGYDADSENGNHNPAFGAPGADVIDASAVFAYLDDTIVAVRPEFAEAVLNVAIEIFARHGHTIHPGKSGCWSFSTASNILPSSCQRIWAVKGLLVGEIPVYNESEDPIRASEKLSEIVAKARREAEFLVRIIYDD